MYKRKDQRQQGLLRLVPVYPPKIKIQYSTANTNNTSHSLNHSQRTTSRNLPQHHSCSSHNTLLKPPSVGVSSGCATSHCCVSSQTATQPTSSSTATVILVMLLTLWCGCGVAFRRHSSSTGHTTTRTTTTAAASGGSQWRAANQTTTIRGRLLLLSRGGRSSGAKGGEGRVGESSLRCAVGVTIVVTA